MPFIEVIATEFIATVGKDDVPRWETKTATAASATALLLLLPTPLTTGVRKASSNYLPPDSRAVQPVLPSRPLLGSCPIGILFETPGGSHSPEAFRNGVSAS